MDAMQDDDDDDNNPDSSEIGGPPSSASKRVTFASTAANTSSSSITPTHPMTSHITDLIDIAWTFIVDETRQMVDARLLGDDDDENDDGACNANGMVFPVANGVADRRLPPPRVLIDGIVTCWNAVLVLVSLCAEESLVTELLERKKIW